MVKTPLHPPQGLADAIAAAVHENHYDGLVWREVEPTVPPQVTYEMTAFGCSVGEPLGDLFDRITRGLSGDRLRP